MDYAKHITKNLKNILGDLGPVEIEHPGQKEHGDYSTNIALTIFAGANFENKDYKTPKDLANWIKNEYEKLEDEYIAKVEVAGSGFVNFFLKHDVLVNGLKHYETENISLSLGEKKTIVVEYSSPNIAKPFGIGHLRSTIIGQAVYNLYKELGYKVIGVNHIGDWGTQFGMLIYKIKEKKLNVSSLVIGDLEKLYVEFNKEMKEKPELRDEARRWFKRLEDGDNDAHKIWEELNKISFEEYQKIYKLLGIEIDNTYPESFYENMLEGVIQECKNKGIAKMSQGALIIEYSDGLTPGIIQKSDGASTYLTRDLATIKYRIDKWKPDFVIYEVGAEQTLHFKQLFSAAKLLGWANKEDFYHLAHGLYLSPSGKKFSTREGDTIHLIDILLEAVEKAKKLSKDENDEVASAVGIGAVKYFDLSHQPGSDIIFDWKKIFALEGNSAPYIQYAHARAHSVIEKSGTFVNFDVKSSPTLNNEELALLRHYYRYPEVIKNSAKNYSPNLLVNYLFELSQLFNHFYNTNRIIEADPLQKELRLAITLTVKNILKSGLKILGILAPTKM